MNAFLVILMVSGVGLTGFLVADAFGGERGAFNDIRVVLESGN